ncbi:MAG: ATP-binding protein [Thermoflexibacter sp.]|jgi:signal transduction histidine kinase/ligand-binding sensor domain-containing protein|nr:ATP-binding protein [Thermoflexibacter sp.]
MSKFLPYVISCILSFSHFTINAQVPFIQHYTSENTPPLSNVFAILQNQKGQVYVSGANDLCIYNGATWEVISSISTTIRTIAEDKDGTIWVGTIAGFGYLQENSVGKRTYISLSDQLPENEKILPTAWQIHTTKYGIYVCTQKFIFLFQKDIHGKYQKITSFPAKDNYIFTFKVEDKIYITEANEAETQNTLRYIENQKIETLYTDTTRFVILIFDILKHTENAILLITERKGIYVFDLNTKELKPYPTLIDDVLSTSFPYCAIRLKNGNIAIGTVYNGIFIIDNAGNLLQHISESNGLMNNNIYCLMEDRQGNLWAGSGQNIVKIAFSLPFTTFNKFYDVKGRIHSLLKDKNTFYLGSDLGIFYLESNKFKLVEGTQSQHWQLLPYKNGILSAGGNKGIFYLENKKIISKLYAPNSIMQIAVAQRDSSIIYVATYGGLRIYSFENKQFKDLGLLKDTQSDCRSLYELPDGRLWVGTTSNGFYLVEFPKNIKKEELVQQANVKHYTKGLNETQHNKLYFADNKLLFTSKTGIYTFNPSKEIFEKTNLCDIDFSLPRYQNPIIKQDKKGNIWLLNALSIAQKQANGRFLLDSLSLLPIEKKANTLSEDAENTYWIANDEAIYRLDKNVKSSYVDIQTYIYRVSLSQSDSLLALDNTRVQTLEYKNNSLIFNFFTNNLLNEKENQYQYFLENYDKKWSEWTSLNQKEYTNLREGTYTFRVKSRTHYRQMSKETFYSFSILPPWYRTWWAYGAYATLFIGFIYLIIKLYTKNLLKEKEKLEQIVSERTKEILKQNELLNHQKESILLQQAELINQKEEILTQAEELVKMNATKDKLFSIISHDLKSPFNRLRGILRLLDMDGLSQEEFLDYSRKLRKNADNLYDTLENLLKWSMLQMQKGMVTTFEKVNIFDVVEEVSKLYDESLQEKEITIFNQTDRELSAHADLDQVKLILRNLIANAIKFTHKGGKILVINKIVKGKLKISIIDEGIGMSQEQMSKLFDISANTTQKGTLGEKGTGIGLLLVKEFIENNRGEIEIQSQEGKGSSFTVSLNLYSM